MTDSKLKPMQPRIIYELTPLMFILSGALLAHGVGSMFQLIIGIVEIMIGVIILSVRCEYRFGKKQPDTKKDTIT